jgi:hypothetical protein
MKFTRLMFVSVLLFCAVGLPGFAPADPPLAVAPTSLSAGQTAVPTTIPATVSASGQCPPAMAGAVQVGVDERLVPGLLPPLPMEPLLTLDPSKVTASQIKAYRDHLLTPLKEQLANDRRTLWLTRQNGGTDPQLAATIRGLAHQCADIKGKSPSQIANDFVADNRRIDVERTAARNKREEERRAVTADWRLATAGDAKAMVAYGRHLWCGIGVTRDDKSAVSWFLKAAAKNDPSAMYYLGDYFEFNNNRSEAYAWFRRAAALNFSDGYNSAQERIDQMITSDRIAAGYSPQTFEAAKRKQWDADSPTPGTQRRGESGAVPASPKTVSTPTLKNWKATFKIDGNDMVEYFTAETSGDAFNLCLKEHPKANSIDVNPA